MEHLNGVPLEADVRNVSKPFSVESQYFSHNSWEYGDLGTNIIKIPENLRTSDISILVVFNEVLKCMLTSNNSTYSRQFKSHICAIVAKAHFCITTDETAVERSHNYIWPLLVVNKYWCMKNRSTSSCCYCCSACLLCSQLYCTLSY